MLPVPRATILLDYASRHISQNIAGDSLQKFKATYLLYKIRCWKVISLGTVYRSRLFLPPLKIIHHLKLRIAFRNHLSKPAFPFCHPWKFLHVREHVINAATFFFYLPSQMSGRRRRGAMLPTRPRHTDTWTRLRKWTRALMRLRHVLRRWPLHLSSGNNVFNVINSASYGAETERKRNQIYGLSAKIARIRETRQGSR